MFVMHNDSISLSVDVCLPLLSDHSLIIVAVDMRALAAAPDQRPCISRRRWATFNIDNFVNTLNKLPLLLKSTVRGRRTVCLLQQHRQCYSLQAGSFRRREAICSVDVALVRPRLLHHKAADAPA